MAAKNARKPGPGSSQAEISAYIKQELDKKMSSMKKLTSATKKTPKLS